MPEGRDVLNPPPPPDQKEKPPQKEEARSVPRGPLISCKSLLLGQRLPLEAHQFHHLCVDLIHHLEASKLAEGGPPVFPTPPAPRSMGRRENTRAPGLEPVLTATVPFGL